MALTPMVLTARLLKEKEPDCKIVFVGPCAAKKLEASRKSVRSYVDFVLTFEEVQGMFDAKNVNFKELPDGEPLKQASSDGRGFAVSGGVGCCGREGREPDGSDQNREGGQCRRPCEL